jgi:hypothetical protein
VLRPSLPRIKSALRPRTTMHAEVPLTYLCVFGVWCRRCDNRIALVEVISGPKIYHLRRTQPSETCELHDGQLLRSLSLCFEALQIADEYAPAIDPDHSLCLQPAEIA